MPATNTLISCKRSMFIPIRQCRKPAARRSRSAILHGLSKSCALESPGRVQLVGLDSERLAQLEIRNYRARVERGFIIEFDAGGLMQRRYASINDMPIAPSDRKFHWPQGRRPDDHPGLSDLG